MPERDVTPEGDITDVMRLTEAYDVTCDTVEITPVIHVMRKILPLYAPLDLVSFALAYKCIPSTRNMHKQIELKYFMAFTSFKFGNIILDLCF